MSHLCYQIVIVLVSLATLTYAMVVELFPSGNSLAAFAASLASLFISSYRAVSWCPVDIHYGDSLLQNVEDSPDISGNWFITCILPVKGENTNCRLVVAEYTLKRLHVIVARCCTIYSRVIRMATSSTHKTDSHLLTGLFKQTGCCGLWWWSLLLFHKIPYLTPGHNWTTTRSSYSAQYCRYQIYSDAPEELPPDYSTLEKSFSFCCQFPTFRLQYRLTISYS